MAKILRQRYIAIWQFIFILLGSSWLLAPDFNRQISAQTTLISQYETTGQHYALLFRVADLVASLLLITVVYLAMKRRLIRPKNTALVLIAIGLLMALDPIAITQCHIIAGQCREITSSMSFYIHAAETVLGAMAILLLTGYYAIIRRQPVTIAFFCFQILYGILALANLASTYHFATISQYIYQLAVIIWLAWFVGEILHTSHQPPERPRLVRHLFAAWTYVGGLVTIIVSFRQIRFLHFIQNLYIPRDTAWLAQHGVLVGILFLYISRHLWRGEHRARQLMLALLAIEVIKNAIISPNAPLTVFYSVLFGVLFVARPYFTRGATPLPWYARLQEAGLVLIGGLGSFVITLFVLSFNPRFSEVEHQMLHHLSNFVLTYQHVPRRLLRSDLLADTLEGGVIGLFLIIIWSFFRPVSMPAKPTTDIERSEAEDLLRMYSNSSEDYFKLWPEDKEYFWSKNRLGFIAYKTAGSVVFCLADPIAASDRQRASLIKEFVTTWSRRGFRVCFVPVQQRSLSTYTRFGFSSQKIGSSAVINITEFCETTARNKWWRWQLNRASRLGYTHHVSVAPHQPQLLERLQIVSDTWLRRPGHREQAFALGYFDIDYLNRCSIHYVSDESGEIIAFTNLLPIYNGQRQTTVDLMRFEPDREGVMPFLLAQILFNLKTETNFSHFDLGFVPLAQVHGALTTVAKRFAGNRFSSSGLEQFKNKFEPEWQGNYLVYDGDIGDFAAIALKLDQVMEPPELDS